MILVTGATGNVGRELVDQLASKKVKVRAVSRNRSRTTLPPGVEAVSADLNDPDALQEHLHDVDSIFLLAGYAGTEALLRTARDRGVSNVVLLSASCAVHGDLKNAIARYHILDEQQVKSSEMHWSILRPVSFMSNTLRWAEQLRNGDTVYEPFTDVPVAVIDPADIASVAIECLVDESHAGMTYTLTGPEALLPEGRAKVLSHVLGRDITLIAESDAEARESLRARMSEPYVDAFFELIRGGLYDEATVLSTVDDVTSKPARTFVEWARAHAGEFA